MAGLFNLDPEQKMMLAAASASLLGGQNVNQQLGGIGQNMLPIMQNRYKREQEEQQKNKTLQFLQRVNPGLAQQVEAGLPIEYAWKSYLESQKPKERNLKAVGKMLYDADSGQWITPPADAMQNDAEYGLNPQYGVDKDGNPVLLQVGKHGQAVQTKLPEGVSLSKEPIKIDAGTHFVLLDPITRQPVGNVPKDIAGAEAEKARGKLAGEAVQQLPQTIAKADQALSVIDRALAHPGREKTTGWNSVFDPRTYMPGTDSADFQAVHKQILGKAFLEAFETLKGGGQITEVEGEKATQAIARLNLAQSDEAYMEALLELRGVIEAGKRRALAMAQQSGAETPVEQQPVVDQQPAVQSQGVNRTSTGVTWKKAQ